MSHPTHPQRKRALATALKRNLSRRKRLERLRPLVDAEATLSHPSMTAPSPKASVLSILAPHSPAGDDA